MSTTFNDMSIVRRYINATDGFDHAAKRQDGLNRKKSSKRGNRVVFYYYAVGMLQDDYDKFTEDSTRFNVGNLFETLSEAFKPNRNGTII